MTAYDAIYLTETEHSLLDHSDVPGAAQSGASVAGLGDFMSFYRMGAYDETSLSFNYANDTDTESGTSITIDEDAGFLGNWGAPVPLLAEGVYAVTAKAVGAVDGTIALRIWVIDTNGDNVFSNNNLLPNVTVGTVTPGFRPIANVSLTFYAPEGTHIDIGFTSSGTPDESTLLIQKVG